MSCNPLIRIMNPSSIAIVGASNNFKTMGTIQLFNLLNSGFPGEVLPVHPKEEKVLGKKAYASVEDLPYPPDLAVLVVPTRLVPEMLEAFGKLGTSHAVIITAGFKETGESGLILERSIVDIAQTYGIRFLGPNCLGIVNSHLPLNITVAPLMDTRGKLSLASQSGTYVAQTVNFLHKNGIVLNKAISVGNEANIDITDCIEYLGNDESTRAIGLYIEGIRDAGRFLEVARRVSRTKPIIAQYVGGTEAGARSGSSHTGAMAGPDYVYDGLFEQAGIIRVETIEEVFRTGWALATQPPLTGKRIAVLTNSGGPGTGISTTCNANGLEVPEFSETLQNKISRYLPGHASAKNPVDLTFHIDMEALTEKIPRELFASDEIHGVIIHGIMDTGFMELLYPYVKDYFKVSKEDFLKNAEISMEPLLAMPETYKKPLMISSFFGREDHCMRVFHEHGIPTFDSPEKTAKAMGALLRHLHIRTRALNDPVRTGHIPDGAENIINQTSSRTIDEYRAKKLLRAYGIPTTTEELAESLEAAEEHAHTIGYPVALKVCSPDISHKTESGLVHLNIRDKDALKAAYTSINSNGNNLPVLISQMLHGDREFMAGISHHPGFPPCVMFGLGGIFAEALNDITIRLAPLSLSDAMEMIENISARALIGSYRNMQPVEKDTVAAILIALSQIALDFPGIKEIDLNPIIVQQGKPTVADALIITE
ncbi:MAG TPA: acetate--CoA ligase family protein [Deltaproteobacteria bacterium]|nr:acetate--CoA ligase family protein [Deltaproteobacteria bacterium]